MQKKKKGTSCLHLVPVSVRVDTFLDYFCLQQSCIVRVNVIFQALAVGEPIVFCLIIMDQFNH